MGPGGTCENGKCTCNEDFYYIKYHVGINETRNVCELKKGECSLYINFNLVWEFL